MRMLDGLVAAFGGRTLNRFSTQKTGMMLAYLCLSLPEEVPCEDMAVRLWPDLDRAAQLNNVRVTRAKLKRDLRRGLRLKDAFLQALLPRKRLAVKLDPGLVMTDVAAFRQARDRAEAAAQRGDREAQAQSLEEAARLYGAGFLPGTPGEWVRLQRKDLALQYRAVLEQLAVVRDMRGDARGAEQARVALSRHDLAFQKAYPPAAERGPAAEPPLFGVSADRIENYHRALAGDRDSPPAARMLVLTGPEGVGRSRLAREVAATFRDWKDYRTCQVALAGLSGSEDILEALARALGLTHGASPYSRRVAEFLRDRRTVLVLDDLGPRADLEPVRFLLQDVPLGPGAGLVLLATAREALHWPEALQERLARQTLTEPVRPLQTPQEGDVLTPERLQRMSGVQLFLHCARAAGAAFSLSGTEAPAVAALCRMTAGAPEAIQSVASWAGQYSPARLLALLEASEQPVAEPTSVVSTSTEPVPSEAAVAAPISRAVQAVQAAHALSHDLLPPPVQQLFRDVAVFRGGCTVRAAQAVCGVPLAQEHLDALVRYRLVRIRDTRGGPRFELNGAARAFAAGRRGVLPSYHARARLLERRHTDFFLELAGEARRNSRGPEQGRELDRLAQEWENLDAVLKRCLPRGINPPQEDALRGLRLACLLWEFWNQRGYWQYGREWLERALRYTRQFGGLDDRATAFNAAAVIAAEQGDLDAARGHAESSVRLAEEWAARESGPEPVGRRAEARNTCGYVARRQAERAQQQGDVRRALECVRAARRFYEAAAADYLDAWGDLSVFWPYNGLGQVALLEYDLLKDAPAADGPTARAPEERITAALAEGARWLERCLDVAMRTSDQGSLAQALRSLADATFEQARRGEAGKYVLTWIYLEKCVAIWRDIGDWGSIAVGAERLARLAAVEGDWDKAMRLCGMAWAMRRKANLVAPGDGGAEEHYRHDMGAALSEVATAVGSRASPPDEASLRAAFAEGASAMARDSSSAAAAARLVLDARAW
ncbi:MAG: AAA family ATPase [Armatimonadetes bacterium]|nr:AAA family ATPase [Armatimonadota bacterium]